jgi:hypothetical protein
VFDALKYDPKTPPASVTTVNLGTTVNAKEVYKLLAFKSLIHREGIDAGLTIVLVENQVQEQRKDRLTVGKILANMEGGTKFEVIKQI